MSRILDAEPGIQRTQGRAPEVEPGMPGLASLGSWTVGRLEWPPSLRHTNPPLRLLELMSSCALIASWRSE
jgi:hypothetical protein